MLFNKHFEECCIWKIWKTSAQFNTQTIGKAPLKRNCNAAASRLVQTFPVTGTYLFTLRWKKFNRATKMEKPLFVPAFKNGIRLMAIVGRPKVRLSFPEGIGEKSQTAPHAKQPMYNNSFRQVADGWKQTILTVPDDEWQQWEGKIHPTSTFCVAVTWVLDHLNETIHFL